MNGQSYKVTAFYDTRQGAEDGADLLKGNGFASSTMDIIHGEGGTGRAHEKGGFMHKLSRMFMPDEDRHAYAEGIGRGGYVLSIDVAEGDHRRVVELLDTGHGVDMDERSGTWREEGWKGTYEGSGAVGAVDEPAAASADTTDEGRIEVVEEQLKVGKRDVSHGRVRVRSYTVAENVSTDVELERERAEVQRHAVDRVVRGAEADQVFQDKEIVVEERAEEAVVAKETRVVEEIRVRKQVDQETREVTDTVRRTEVDIDREPV